MSIDLAVLGKNVTTISQMADSHHIAVAPLTTNINDFKQTFFNGNVFNIVTPVNLFGLPLIKIDKAILDNSTELDLYDTVIQFAADDLDIDVSAITNVSKVNLYKECHNLNMSSFNIVSSLRWTDISDIITQHPIIITVVLTNHTHHIKNICIKFTYIVNA